MPKEHVEELAEGGHACRHCGGAVGEDGYSLSLEPEESEKSAEVEVDEGAFMDALEAES